MNWVWLLAFLLVQVAIGAYAARRVGSEADFLVAGRRLGTPLVALSLFATWFGAETCLGASGAVYRDGLSGARADPLGYAVSLLLMGLFLATRLSEGKYLTLGDLYRERFGPGVERLAILIILPSSLIWGAAQLRAFGQVLALTNHLEIETAMAVSAGLIVVYTFVGGLMGDVITDVVQGGLLSVGLVILGGLVLVDLPEQHAIETSLALHRTSFLPDGESIWAQLDRWSVPIFGSLITQELIARVLAARSPKVAQRGALVASGLYLCVGAIPILLGLLGPALLPDLGHPEQLLPSLARARMPHALYMLFTLAMLAAILSTVDSILLSVAGLVSHNLLVPLLRLQTERKKLWSSRAVVVAAGAVAYLVATRTTTVYELVETASAFGTAGILVTTVAGLLTRGRGSPVAASLALILGLVTTPIVKYAFQLSAPFLITLLVASLAYLVATQWGRWAGRRLAGRGA